MRSRTSILLMVLMVFSACTKTIEIPRNEFEAASQDASASHRIRTADNNEFVAEAFTVTDSTVVILRLSPADTRYRTGDRVPIVLNLQDVESIKRLHSSETPAIVAILFVFAMIYLATSFDGGIGYN